MKKIIQSSLLFCGFLSSCFAVESKESLAKNSKAINNKKLSEALISNNQPFLHKYLDSKNIDSRDKNNNTLLHKAIELGHEHAIALLLNKKANVNALNNKNKTPLHIAAKKGNTKVVISLLANKAKVNAKTNKNKTALHYAAQKGNKDIVATLLSQGADITAFDRFARTPMHTAIENNQIEVMQMLETYAQTLAKNPGKAKQNEDN